MQFSDSDLRAASTAGVLDSTQLARLIEFLDKRNPAASQAPSATSGPDFRCGASALVRGRAHRHHRDGAVLHARLLADGRTGPRDHGFRLCGRLRRRWPPSLVPPRPATRPAACSSPSPYRWRRSRSTASRMRSAGGASSASPARLTISTSGSKAAGSSWRSRPSWRRPWRYASTDFPSSSRSSRSRCGSCRWTSRPGSPASDYADWETQAPALDLVRRGRARDRLYRRSQPAQRRLRLLALPVRPDGVLGRDHRHLGRHRARQGALLRDERRAFCSWPCSSAGACSRCSA